MSDKPPPSHRLSDLVPEGIFVGVSLILRRGDHFLFGIRPAKREGEWYIYELTGIGGGLEPVDASYSAGAIREAWEEIKCPIRLLACQETLVVRGPDDVKRGAVNGDERPAAVVLRNHGTPAHRPWHPGLRGSGCLLVFAAELLGEPLTSPEHPHLLWLYPEQVLETARNDVSLQSLLDSGGQLVAGTAGPLPASSPMRMTDSQEALVLALGDEAPAVYRSLHCR
jgi:8-oxo-dGTP pyrophosphatase MutT (NUDIX family)